MERHTIRIIGDPHLHNRLLSSYLKANLNTCCSVVSANRFRPRAGEQDLLLFDYQARDGLDLLLSWAEEAPPSPVAAALFMVPSGAELNAFIGQAHFKGVFFETASEELLLDGIKAVLAGELWLPRKAMAAYLQRTRTGAPVAPLRPPSEPLTQRELQVLELLCAGGRNGIIASILGLSPHTVKTHISNLYKKIDARNRLEAVNWARVNMHFETAAEV